MADPLCVLHDPRRLSALRSTGLLDSPPEEMFDRVTRLAARLLNAPVALVTLVDEDRQFFKSAFGLPEPLASQRQTPLSVSYCQFAAASGEPLVIEDAREHPLVKHNPSVAGGAVAYAGLPLKTSEGHTLGTFCVVDSKPRKWTEEELTILADLAASVEAKLELRAAVRHAEGQAEFARRILESSRDCIKVLDLDAGLLSMSAAGQRLLEIDDLSPHLGCCWVEFWEGEEHAAAAAAVAAARAGGVGQFQGCCPGQRGTPKWWDVIVTPIPGADGRPERLLAVSRDITEQKRAEGRLHAQHAVARALAEASSLTEAVPRVLEAVCRSSGWQWGAFWQADGRANLLRCVEVWYEPALQVDEFEHLSRTTTLGPGAGLPGRVWATGRPAWVTDVTTDPAFVRKSAAVAAGLHGAVCFPVSSDGHMLGVMEFFSPAVRPPDEPLLGMIQGVGRQVGQFMGRRAAEEALLRSEARNAAVLQAALDCIVSMDHDGRVTEWNPAAEQTFGYSRGEAVGREMAELIIPPALRERHRAGLAKYLATGEGPIIGSRLEIAAVRKDGGEFPVELAVTRVPVEGTPSFTGYLRDITERKRAEEERTRLLAAEQKARLEAEAANRRKDQFVAVVSHELRTPLTPVLATVAAMEADPRLPDDVREDVRTLRRNVELEARLVNDLLDLSGTAAGKVKLHFETVDAHAAVRQTLDACRREAGNKGLTLALSLDAANPYVWADPIRFRQVLWNLIGNAVKFTAAGGRVMVASADEGGQLALHVTDTGIGIAPEHLPRIFDAFDQGDVTVTRQFGGLGLGLTISKMLAEAHGGTLTVASEGQGRGATFALRLRSVAAPEPATTPPVFREPRPTGRGPLRVLLVEDHEDTCRVMARLLRSSGYRVATANTVRQALAELESAEFDLLVSDLGLPDGTGWELMRLIGGERSLKGIALSGYGTEDDLRRSRESGFMEHLTKPVDLARLMSVIQRVAS